MSDDSESSLTLSKDIRTTKHMIRGDWMQAGNYTGHAAGYKLCLACGSLFFQSLTKPAGELTVMIAALMAAGMSNVAVNQTKITPIPLRFKRSVTF